MNLGGGEGRERNDNPEWRGDRERESEEEGSILSRGFP